MIFSFIQRNHQSSYLEVVGYSHSFVLQWATPDRLPPYPPTLYPDPSTSTVQILPDLTQHNTIHNQRTNISYRTLQVHLDIATLLFSQLIVQNIYVHILIKYTNIFYELPQMPIR